jgi:hypothetical protein
MPHLSVDEAVHLSVGIEPETFSTRDFADFEKKPSSDLWPAIVFFLRRREQFRRQFDPQRNGWKVQPRDLIAWIDRVELEVHPEFLQLLRKLHGGASSPAGARPAAPRPDKREVDTVAQLFTAMAIEYFGYDPKALRSPVTKEIAELAASMGIELSDDTVRKYLQIGARFIPDDWMPNSR